MFVFGVAMNHVNVMRARRICASDEKQIIALESAAEAETKHQTAS